MWKVVALPVSVSAITEHPICRSGQLTLSRKHNYKVVDWILAVSTWSHVPVSSY